MPLKKRKVATHANAPPAHSIPANSAPFEDLNPGYRDSVCRPDWAVRPAADQWWGVRSGAIRDPFGYRWSVHSIVERIPIEEMQQRADTLGLYPPPDISPVC